ncbi:MAG: hypothetical protein OXU61_12700 [Gammaproteobacteria bacterium]|nr:hypothetical protein [Gammaproteobacteria bacterium]
MAGPKGLAYIKQGLASRTGARLPGRRAAQATEGRPRLRAPRRPGKG